MTLSLVFACYNGGQYLEAALYQAFATGCDEVILVDDGSDEGTRHTIRSQRKLYPSLKVVAFSRNQGANSAFYEGVKLATSEWVTCQAVDDCLYLGFWKRSREILNRYPQARVLLSGVKMNDLHNRRSYHRNRLAGCPCFLQPREFSERGRKGQHDFHFNGAIYRRETWLNEGGYRQDLRSYSDWWLLYVTAFRHGLAWTPEVLSEFNQRRSSFSTDVIRDRFAQKAIFCNVLKMLDTSHKDVAPLFKESCCLAPFGLPVLESLYLNRPWRHYITLSFCHQWSRWFFMQQGKNISPSVVAKAFYGLQSAIQPGVEGKRIFDRNAK